jgi:hypothetical protein
MEHTGNRKLKPFSSFMREEFPPPMAVTPPTNVADGTKIAGLPPDMPPVNKSNILKRKKRKT